MEEASSLPWNHLPGPVLSLVRHSCAALLHQNPHVQLDDAGVNAFVESLDHTKLQKLPKKAYPLTFKTPAEEINFICTLALLQLGSGWRLPLHKLTGRGAAETMTFGCMGLHISGEITANKYLNLSLFDIAQTFGLKITEDYELQPGIHSERNTELYSLAVAIRKVLQDTGTMLRNLGHDDWASYWLGRDADKKADPVAQVKQPNAGEAVAKLVRFFAGLQDAYVLPPTAAAAASSAPAASAAAPPADAGAAPVAASAAAASSPAVGGSSEVGFPPGEKRTVYVLKKAQLIVAELHIRFHDEDPRLNFTGIEELTVFSDNVVPAVLRAHNVLKYSEPLAKTIDENKPLNDREQEASVRAGAVLAAEVVVEQYNKKWAKEHPADSPPLTPLALDYHLWLSGKNPALRKLPRHATKSIYY